MILLLLSLSQMFTLRFSFQLFLMFDYVHFHNNYFKTVGGIAGNPGMGAAIGATAGAGLGAVGKGTMAHKKAKKQKNAQKYGW